MATESNQRLTFYEDLYLRPHNKWASMPCRRTARMSTAESARRTKRQSSGTESQRRSWSKSPPVNNPLLDSPPSARPLTLAAAGRASSAPASDTKTSTPEDDNNNDYLRLSEAVQMLPPSPAKHAKDTDNITIYENHPLLPSTRVPRKVLPRQTASKQIDHHVYEEIPEENKGLQNTQYYYQKIRCFTDESNYITSSKGGRVNKGLPTKTSDTSETSATNLKSMRRMGRSADSIRCAPGNKVRSQSTVVTPQLGVKHPQHFRLGSSISCDNIITSGPSPNANLGRLSTQSLSTSLEKTTSSSNYLCPMTRQLQSDRGGSKPIGSQSSPTRRRQPFEIEKNRAVILRSAKGASRSMPSTHRRQPLRHSSATYAGSGSPSAYENIEEISKTLHTQQQGCANYVNIGPCLKDMGDLNYADLDFTSPPEIEKPRLIMGSKNYRSATPNKITSTASDEDNDNVEYTTINIAATEAARLACAEHQQHRQRQPH